MKREYGFDLLRIIACFSLFPFHYCIFGQMNEPYGFQVTNEIVKTICGFPVAWFVMMSGTLFLNREKLDIKRLYTHNIAHIALVYIFWSAIYAIFDVLINLQNVTDIKNLLIWIIFDIRDSHFHLWYLPMIIGIYILIPIVHSAFGAGRNPDVLKYSVRVFIVFGVIIYTLLLIPVPAETYKILLTKVEVGSFAGWLGFFLFGYFLYNIRFNISKKIMKLLIAASFLSLAVMLAVHISRIPFEGINTFLTFFTIPAFIIETTVYLLFVGIGPCENRTRSEFVATIADTMLGVYCIHDLVMSLVHMVFDFIPNNLFLLRLFIVTPLSFVISIVIIWLMRKAKVFRLIAV